MAQHYYKDMALKLFDLGYKPIPIRPNTKIPFMKKEETWQREITRDLVTHWAENGKGGGGIGLTGLGGIDCDIKDKDVSNKLIKFIGENISGECLVRVGQPPKFLVPVNQASDIEKKWKNTWYDQAGVKHEIEFLAPGDQYFLGYGIHPDTRKPFKWVQDRDLLAVKAEDLVTLDALDLAAIEDEFDQLAEAAGWTREAPPGTKAAGKKGKAGRGQSRGQSGDPLENLKVPGQMADPAGLAELGLWVDYLPQDYVDDYDLWISTGAAMHHETAGSGEGLLLFDEWSKKSDKYKGMSDTVARWESFNAGKGLKDGGNCSARGTIIHALKECGRWKQAEREGKQAREEVLGATAATEQNQTCADAIDKLNENHALVLVGGKYRIMKEFTDHDGKRDILFMTVPDFHLMHMCFMVPNPRDPKQLRKASRVWLESPKRREYDGVVFEPSRVDIPRYYNFWRGLSVQPKKGDWSLFRQHIYEIIADGNEIIGDWVIAWIARIIQDPGGKRPGTSIVMRGGQGAGKGLFAHYIGKVFGENYLPVSHAEQVSGRFNSHLKDKILVFIDEGFWAGDKKSEGVLKSIITEPFVAVEQKGMDIIRVRNHVNILIASNNEWVIPANIQERRFCVLDVNGRYMRKHRYFEEIGAQMDNGGLEAMVYDLLKLDISGVNLKQFEQTQGLWEQKVHSMTTHESYWLERLMDGQMLAYVEDHSAYGDFANADQEWGEVDAALQHDDYLLFAGKMREGYPKSPTEWGLFVNKVCPGVTKIRPRRGKERRLVRRFPTLEECRSHFEQYVNTKIEWEKGEDECPF